MTAVLTVLAVLGVIGAVVLAFTIVLSGLEGIRWL